MHYIVIKRKIILDGKRAQVTNAVSKKQKRESRPEQMVLRITATPRAEESEDMNSSEMFKRKKNNNVGRFGTLKAEGSKPSAGFMMK